MSNYSEKELLLLSEFIYLNASVTDKSISEILNTYRDASGRFTEDTVSGISMSGDLSPDRVVDLFEEMERQTVVNPEFGELSATRKLNERTVRAICYTNSKDENPVVVFRGTGGTKEAWIDNMEGGFWTDTKLQSLAADFVKTECSSYSNITVTGHSKGGNLSQYVTVMCPDMVDRCISFDGQGFNKQFINDNKKLVEMASPKIKSISAHNDFVNILLTPIAGEIVYVANKGKNIDGHSAMTLIFDNEYDDKGNIKSTTVQDPAMYALKIASNRLVEGLDSADEIDKSMICQVLGGTIATALTSTKDEAMLNTYGTATGGIMALLVKKLQDMTHIFTPTHSLYSDSMYYDEETVLSAANILEDNLDRMGKNVAYLRELTEKLDVSVTTYLYVEKKLKIVNETLNKIYRMYDIYCTQIRVINDMYRRSEEKALEIVSNSIK